MDDEKLFFGIFSGNIEVYLPILRGNRVELEPALRIVSFLCWIPNVIVIENTKMRHSKGVNQPLKLKLRESYDRQAVY